MRMHVAINVRNLEPSLSFYNLLFQAEPTKVKENYAKFELDNSALAGLMPLDEMNTTCCYAVQDKIWVTDPEGNPWEVFYTKEDSEFEAAEDRVMPSVCHLRYAFVHRRLIVMGG
jgi:catechol-2,3-dioxygenase